jgi:hypothetical protein
MPLAALELTWQHDSNNLQAATGAVLTTHRQLWRLIKNAMLAFGTLPWTTRYSCDSVVAGAAGDGVDRWDSDADLVWQAAASGTARSWYVMRNTDGVEILIECRAQTTTSGKQLGIYMSPSAGFTGGTTTQRPTATDEQVLTTGDVNTQGHVGCGPASNTTDRAYAYHLWHSTDGLVTIVAICHAGNCSGLWYFGRVSQPIGGWTKPVVGAVWGEGSTPPVAISYTETVDRVSDATNPRTGARFNATSAPWYCATLGFGNGSVGGTEPGGRQILVANEISNEWEHPQVTIGCAASGARGMAHGRLYDIRFVSAGRTTGDTFPDDGSRTRVVMGPFILPWDGSVPVAA